MKGRLFSYTVLHTCRIIEWPANTLVVSVYRIGGAVHKLTLTVNLALTLVFNLLCNNVSTKTCFLYKPMSAGMFKAHNWPTHALKTVLWRMSQRIDIPVFVECLLVCTQHSFSPLRQNARVCWCVKSFLNFTACSAICVESNLEKPCGRN